MQPKLKTCEINGLIRRNHLFGKIDFDKFLKIIQEFAALAAFYPGRNILIDQREANVAHVRIETLMAAVQEFVRFMPSFNKKIATVIRKDPESVIFAQRFKACMMLYDYDLKNLTDIEGALAWLSDEK